MHTGTVYRSTGSWYTVKSDAQFYDCRIKGRLRIAGIKSTNPVAVGDRVNFELDASAPNQGIIYEVEDRRNYLVRKSVNLSKQTHILAANIDQLFLMVTLDNPPTHLPFIDRFLVTVEAYGIQVVLVFNKADTYDDIQKETLQERMALYTKIGYPCLLISAKNKQGIEEVRTRMQDKVSIIAGHSGAGKSTLVNALDPTLELATAEISEQHQQGQHTTTFAQMYDLEGNIKLIDTPGIKGFGVVEMSAQELGDFFPEIFTLKSQCKYHNCLHVQEPQCAVRKAVEDHQIAPSRYQSYLQLLEEDTTYR
ncbi:MAG: ribosome small subunit-dependent GTPase A [Flavobacteriia bacterium]|nr:ribosome small subunit-dependent GTPase A [Flavobacteriia bacterium]